MSKEDEPENAGQQPVNPDEELRARGYWKITPGTVLRYRMPWNGPVTWILLGIGFALAVFGFASGDLRWVIVAAAVIFLIFPAAIQFAAFSSFDSRWSTLNIKWKKIIPDEKFLVFEDPEGKEILRLPWEDFEEAESFRKKYVLKLKKEGKSRGFIFLEPESLDSQTLARVMVLLEKGLQ